MRSVAPERPSMLQEVAMCIQAAVSCLKWVKGKKKKDIKGEERMVTGRTGKGLGIKGEEMGDNQKTLYVCKKFSNKKKISLEA